MRKVSLVLCTVLAVSGCAAVPMPADMWQFLYNVDQYRYRAVEAVLDLEQIRKAAEGKFPKTDADRQALNRLGQAILCAKVAYADAEGRWNAWIDTLITLVGTNHNVADWPAASTQVTANSAGQGIDVVGTQPCDTAQVTATIGGRADVGEVCSAPTVGTSIPKQTNSGFALAGSRAIGSSDAFFSLYCIAVYRWIPVASMANKTAEALTTPAPPIPTIPSLPIPSPWSAIVDLINMYEKLQQAERVVIISELNSRHWPSYECAADPKQSTCPQPPKPSGGASDQTKP